jgi:hypothetical protein
VEDSWTIRNVSYDFRVAPLGSQHPLCAVNVAEEKITSFGIHSYTLASTRC